MSTLDDLRTWQLERVLPYAQIRVWRAITDADEMAGWSSLDVNGVRALGAPIVVSRRENPAGKKGIIRTFQRPRTFTYTGGLETFSWELTPTRAGTLVRFHVSLDPKATGPADVVEWIERRGFMESQLDALARHLGGGRARDRRRAAASIPREELASAAHRVRETVRRLADRQVAYHGASGDVDDGDPRFPT